MLLVSKLNYRCDWYLLRAKFTNDSNFFVLEVGRGSGVLERSLEIGEVLRGGGRRWWRQEAGLHIFWKKVPENLSRLSFNEFKLATNKTLGYDMPRVKLKMMRTARFFVSMQQIKNTAKYSHQSKPAQTIDYRELEYSKHLQWSALIDPMSVTVRFIVLISRTQHTHNIISDTARLISCYVTDIISHSFQW